ncbi:lipoprotein [Streptomyces sp. NPDC050504]|uniref:lipoprotein n=1 Tax=Streptomyces sp. NPDC050504 TaxID=3365618 RepID=UPI0037B123D1
MQRLVRGAACAVLATGVLAGCSSGTDEGGKPAVSSSSPGKAEGSVTADKKAPAKEDPAKEAAGRVGGSGTPCKLPVSFETAKDWKPKAVAAEDAKLLGPLAKHGPVTLVCQVDAKPAGLLGSLGVWTGNAGKSTPRQVLEAYLDDTSDVTKSEYREVKAGTFAATEVSYTTYSKLMEESRPKTALAVTTPQGAVVLDLGGLDEEEHKEMLPAYELAKKTLSATRP